jgi:hypothetical protein
MNISPIPTRSSSFSKARLCSRNIGTYRRELACARSNAKVREPWRVNTPCCSAIRSVFQVGLIAIVRLPEGRILPSSLKYGLMMFASRSNIEHARRSRVDALIKFYRIEDYDQAIQIDVFAAREEESDRCILSPV